MSVTAIVGRRGPRGAKKQQPTPTVGAINNIKIDAETLQTIVACAAEAFGTNAGLVVSRYHGHKATLARHVAMTIIRYAPAQKITFPALGRIFSRDHTSVMYGVGRVRELARGYPQFEALVAGVIETIGAQGVPLGHVMDLILASDEPPDWEPVRAMIREACAKGNCYKDTAKLCGVSKSYVSKVMRGKRR